MKNWLKIIIALFLAGVLYLGWEYLQIQKQSVLNGRYVPVQQQLISGHDNGYGEFSLRGIPFYYIMDTQSGNIYDKDGKLIKEFKIQ